MLHRQSIGCGPGTGLIDANQYVLSIDWRERQPRAADQNAYLNSHSWEEYAGWHLGLTEVASDETKARYAFVYGDFRRVHCSGPDRLRVPGGTQCSREARPSLPGRFRWALATASATTSSQFP